MPSDQIKKWNGDFGRAYTDRNPRSVAELDDLYTSFFGLKRTALNEEYLGALPRDLAFLEVGNNIGLQMIALSQMGFSQLHGIEIQRYAIAQARKLLPGGRFLQASAFELPFASKAFDVTYTSGLLIHISPEDLPGVLDEIHRCTNRYIWGWEYYADEHTEIPYRGHSALMWKGPFCNHYLDRFDDLVLIRETRVKYRDSDNYDHMFLLEKKR